MLKNSLLFILATMFVLPTSAYSKVKHTKLKLTTAKQIKIPKSIITDQFKFLTSKTQKYDDPSYGAIINYKSELHPYMLVSYYIYPMDEGNIPVEHIMSAQYQSVKAQIIESQKLHGNIDVLLSEYIKTIGDQQSFYHSFNFVGDGTDVISETYLTHKKFHYIKLRISFPRHLATEYYKVSSQLANILIDNTTVKENKNINIGIEVSIPDGVIENEKSIWISNQLAYLVSLAAIINPDNLIHSFQQQIIVMDSFAKISEVLMNNKGRKEYVLYIHDIKDAGFMDEYVWTNMKQPHWKETSDLDLNAYKIWLEKQSSKKLYFSPGIGMVVIKNSRDRG